MQSLKRRLLSVLLIITSSGFSSTQIQSDSTNLFSVDSSTIQELKIDNFDFELFENYTDPDNPKKKLQTGSSSLSWSNKLGEGFFIKYGDGENWKFITLSDSLATQVTID